MEIVNTDSSVPFSSEAFPSKLEAFVKGCQEIVNDHMKASGYNWERILTVEHGKRYVKILSHDGPEHPSRGIWAFVDKTNGDILKPATFHAPAKKARGNVFDADPFRQMTPYGPEYLR